MLADKIHLDFETRSPLDIKKVGAWVYSKHPLTDIISIAFALNASPVKHIGYGACLSLGYEATYTHNHVLNELIEYAANPNILFYAHNAFFEQSIWRNILVARYGFPEIPIRRWRCTAAKAANMSLPRHLGGVTKILNLPIQKDEEGGKIMLTLSKPRQFKNSREIVFWTPEDRPGDFERLYSYNIQDVDAERCVDNALPELPDKEQRVWFLDQEINMRGVRLDLPAIHRILEFIDTTTTRLKAEFQQITNGTVEKPTQVVLFRQWLFNNHGVDLPNLQKNTVLKALLNHELPMQARRALEIRRALSMISTSKYEAMLTRVDNADARLRDILLFYAAITKRWGGRGVQPQNFPRGSVDSNQCIEIIMRHLYDWFIQCYSPMEAFSSCVRGMLIPSPGNDLFVGDFSSIEAMVSAWVAGDEKKLTMFRDKVEIYCVGASKIFDRPITKADKYERLIGKVGELALGYNGGIGAYGGMAKQYDDPATRQPLSLLPAYEALWHRTTEEEQQRARRAYSMYIKKAEREDDPDPLGERSGLIADIIKQRWRAENYDIVQYWEELDEAAIEAVLSGEKQIVGGNGRPEIVYGTIPAPGGVHLLCKLPSGNCIVYPFAKVSVKETPWGSKKHTLSYRGHTEDNEWEWVRIWTYGGKLMENVVQAISRDLLAEAMVRLDDAGYKIVLHVHDEIVSDVPPGFGNIEHYKQLMEVVPDWATGIPVRVEAWQGKRYKKG